MTSIKPWLPEGTRRGLNMTRWPSGNGGTFTGGGWKLVWHTTEGMDFQTMKRVLVDEGYEPHVLIGLEPRRKNFSVCQFIPFTQSALALEHPGGTMETNRANCIQVEICQFSQKKDNWPEALYEALAQLTLAIEYHVPIPRKSPRGFQVPATRLGQQEWIDASGHFGHCHAPSQPSGHWDPGNMRVRHMLKLATKAQEEKH